MVYFVTLFVICFNTFYCTAANSILANNNGMPPIQVMGEAVEQEMNDEEIMKELIQKYWLRDKEEVFRLAKEQDKYIFLLIGRYSCPNCQKVTIRLEEELKKTITEEYILWHSCYDSAARRAEVAEFINQPYQNGTASYLPLVHIINPNDPHKSITGYWGSMSIITLLSLTGYDLPLNESGLTWHENKNEVFRLAKEQNKLVFKFVGRGTSKNSKDVLALLTEDPLRQMLEEHYILWYSKYDDQVTTQSGTEAASETGEENNDADTENDPEEPESITKTPPFIYIINPDEPDVNIVSEWGFKDIEILNDLIEGGIVSNEDYGSSDNKIAIYDNVLYISNNTDNELIRVYSITGQLLYSDNKKEQNMTIDASSFPNGVLIIHSSKGWSSKAVKR